MDKASCHYIEKSMKLYDVVRPLYLETNTSGISLGAGLLQVKGSLNCGHDKIPDNVIMWLIAFASKSLSSVEQHLSNTEHEAVGILHALEKSHIYFGKGASSPIMSH